MYAVEAPKITPARGGLLAIADVITDFDPYILMDGTTFEPQLQGKPTDIPAQGEDKDFEQIGDPTVSVDPFWVYQGLDVSLFDRDGADSKLRESFLSGESFAVEQAVQKLILNPKSVNLTPTPGTPVTNAKVALGLLEQWAAVNVKGLPLIHANRFATSVMSELEVDSNNWTLHTHQGTPIANGGGYGPTGVGDIVAAGGQAWVYISAQLHLYKSTLDITEGPSLKSNRTYFLAEAGYLPVIEGPVAAVLIGSN